MRAGSPLARVRVAALPDRIATLLAGLLPFKIVRPLFSLPSLAKELVWHERTDADAGARFFRALLVETVGARRSSRS